MSKMFYMAAAVASLAGIKGVVQTLHGCEVITKIITRDDPADDKKAAAAFKADVAEAIKDGWRETPLEAQAEAAKLAPVIVDGELDRATKKSKAKSKNDKTKDDKPKA